MRIEEHKGRKAIIKGDHRYSGKEAICNGMEEDYLGWAYIFYIEELDEETKVYKKSHFKFLN